MTLALEINDVGLILAADGELLVEEPGYAMLDGRDPETGAAAARRARLNPLFVETRHWQDLATTTLVRPMPAAATYAEVAHAQLASLVRPHLARDAGVLLAVPAWYTREQLALLLGVAQEAGLRPVGLVDAALASAALEPAPESLLQLELTLHRGVLSVLDHGGELRRTRYEVLPQHGWLALQQAWLDLIAAAFVRKTRFDPLHEAVNEQRLCDGLPGWLATLENAPTVTLEMHAGGATHSVELAREEFAAAASRIYDGLAQALQRARPAGGPLHLRLSHRLVGLPGFGERLAELRDCEVTRLPRGAAALGALAYERTLRRDPGAVVLVQRLPVPLRTGTSPTARPAAAAVPAEDRPTHVVLQSRSWMIRHEPLTIGSAVPAGRRALAIAAGPGISRVHCTLTRGEDGVWLEDLSTYGTLLNGERVRGRVGVRTGDRLRIGNPGVECELVRVVDDDGAA
jgi:hypothetical protein